MQNDGDKLLLARLNDCFYLCKKHSSPKFLHFLNEAEVAFLSKHIPKSENCVFFGGYADAQRKALGVFTNTNIDIYNKSNEELFDYFPICAIRFMFKDKISLSHRDFLGSIMALGIKREAVGDIVVSEGSAIVFCLEGVTKAITELSKIGKVGVRAEKVISFAIKSIELDVQDGTISSNRLDCLLSFLLKKSRTAVKDLIISGRVRVDYNETCSISRLIEKGSVISVRGYGKFKIVSYNGYSKKGKIRVSVGRYI